VQHPTRRLVIALAFVIAPSLASGVAGAQTQIRPRVMLIVDTSGSMVLHVNSTAPDGGDGSYEYFDPSLAAPITIYRGRGGATCNGNQCCLPDGALGSGLGDQSRMANAKRAITNAVNAAGAIDWGLMRYPSETPCPIVNTVSPITSNNTTCNTDLDCAADRFCFVRAGDATNTKRCYRIDNFCKTSANNNSAGSQFHYSRGGGSGQCATLQGPLKLTFQGTCGTNTPETDPACRTLQTCNGDADCSGTAGGRCAIVGPGPVRACQCNLANTACPAGYACDTTQGFCVYNDQCKTQSGNILVDPFSVGYSALAVLPWVDGIERFGAGGTVVNPELRANGNTPLGAAIREATAWYKANVANDPQRLCRPYITVLLTDGDDTCEDDAGGSTTAGPVAAVRGFVAATQPGARVPNKVYVIGLNVSSTTLNNMAAAGGTGPARYATSQEDIQAALADIVASSVLVERCNGRDDDCNQACDEPFDKVAKGAGCTNQKAADTCTNGALAGTKCYATGTYVCSTDELSQVCNAPTCSAARPDLCPTMETCNGQDDDCNGVVDDCTPFVAGSCCTTNCPACAVGGPSPEVCDGCDNDCNGVVDDNPADVNLDCGSNVGVCTPGKTYCCQEASPTTTMCTRSQAPKATNPNRLVCLGGVGPQAVACNGLDNNCDGLKDTPTTSCFRQSDGTPFPATAMPGQGPCTNGTATCTTDPIPAGSPGCPGPKPCANPTATYGPCVGAIGPTTEVCNNIDDDCDGTKDDNVTGGQFGMACCPTGNLADCQNTGGSTRCREGALQCVAGGVQCVGAVTKQTETCNQIDDDCNGVVDDVVGKGAPCTGMGIETRGECRAEYQCVAGMMGSGPNGLVCVPTVTPQPETCNGKDDDCNNVIDDNLQDPRVGVVGGTPCAPLVALPGTQFPATGPQPPCDPGRTACVNGAVVCEGRVGPEPNQCDGISRDCTGVPNSNGNCPTGFQCYMGSCVSPCGAGEFPCPGGFVCVNGLCIADGCTKLACQPGEICRVGNDGVARCEDPCREVRCPTGYRCKEGVCVDDTCRTFGCPAGQRCEGTPPVCVPDPCYEVNCPTGQYCNPAAGGCVDPCPEMCPPGQACVAGTCQGDPCAGLSCRANEVCVVANGTGSCVENLCRNEDCGNLKACCGGTCIDDPCFGVRCPEGSSCTLDPACRAQCAIDAAPPKVEIVGAGGGGWACSVSPWRSTTTRETMNPAGGLGLALLAMVFALSVRALRRQRSDRRSCGCNIWRWPQSS
jgi:hypothetical protein